MPSWNVTALWAAIFLHRVSRAIVLPRQEPNVLLPRAVAARCPAPYLENAGFETGALDPWKCTVYYEGFGSSCEVNNASAAAKTTFAAQLNVLSSNPYSDDEGAGISSNFMYLDSGYFYGCANTTYNLGYSILQVPNGTVFDADLNGSGYAPQLYLYAIGHVGSFYLGQYQFYPGNFTGNIASQPYKTYQPGKWIKQTVPITITYTDVYYFSVYAAAYQNPNQTQPSQAQVRLDQFRAARVQQQPQTS